MLFGEHILCFLGARFVLFESIFCAFWEHAFIFRKMANLHAEQTANRSVHDTLVSENQNLKERYVH